MKKRQIDKEAFGRRLADARNRAKLTQAQLADATGYTQQSIQGFEDGKVARPGSIAEIASALGTTIDWLLYGDLPMSAGEPSKVVGIRSSQPDSVGNNARVGPLLEGFSRVPLRGQGMGGRDGALIFDDTNMGDILAPPKLHGVPGAYAVYVVGTSMDPRFRDGEVVYVHPYQRVVKGDDCVIQVEGANGERLGWIKEFVSRDDKSLKVVQHSPRKTMTFPDKSIVSIHKIIMSGPA